MGKSSLPLIKKLRHEKQLCSDEDVASLIQLGNKLRSEILCEERQYRVGRVSFSCSILSIYFLDWSHFYDKRFNIISVRSSEDGSSPT
jgi:hypothetical protein